MDDREITRLASEFFYAMIGRYQPPRYVNPVWMREYAWTLVAERVRWFTRA